MLNEPPKESPEPPGHQLKCVYTVKPIISEGCGCEDCKAGRHVYLLYRLPATGPNWSAMSMQPYTSPEDCKQNHWWGLKFGPEDTWEDGAPIVVPEPEHKAQPDEHGMVPLNDEALGKSADLLEKHWPQP
jgi:hypothetical protein